jgi:Zn-ribbon RNA-binding protein
MTDQLICNGCGKRVTNTSGTVKFTCPSCGKAELVRCKHCREVAKKFKCPVCGFEGPN